MKMIEGLGTFGKPRLRSLAVVCLPSSHYRLPPFSLYKSRRNTGASCAFVEECLPYRLSFI